MRLSPTRMGAGVAAVAIAMTAIPASASTSPCFDPSAVQSARIHDLRVMLMVNSLKCRARSPATLRSYGQLMEDRYDDFAQHADLVQASLADRYGPAEGRAVFDDYETRIGNYHSGVRPSRELCEDTAAWIDLAAKADHGELQTLSRLMTSRAIPVCRSAQVAGATQLEAQVAQVAELGTIYDTVPVPPPSRIVSRQTVRAPLQDARMEDGVPTYDSPGAGIDTAPVRIERVAPAPGTALAAADAPVAPGPVRAGNLRPRCSCRRAARFAGR